MKIAIASDHGGFKLKESLKKYLVDKGYDVVNNNCEHFSNECAFGEHKSFQVESVMGLLFNLFGGK